MATNLNATQITPPRVSLIDERTGAVSREWYRWFYSLYNTVGSGTGIVPVINGGTGLSTIPTNGQLLIGNGTGYTLNTLGFGAGISVTNGAGTISLANTGVLSNIAGTGISVSAATGNVTIANTGVLSVTGTTPVVSSGGATPAISLAAAYGDTQNPYAAKTANYVLAGPTAGAAAVPTFRALVAGDIPTLGYVTAVSVVSANGFAGTSSGGTTPALTLTTTITGILKGNGTAISAAVANTDYMGVGAPVTKTADFTVADGEIWYINNKSGSTCTVTLPAASSWTGRTLTFKNMQAQTLVSASSNVVPIDSTSAGTAILLAVVGNWATMVSDGTNWIIMQQAANNCLLLE
jgi:hypothetical protein